MMFSGVGWAGSHFLKVAEVNYLEVTPLGAKRAGN